MSSESEPQIIAIRISLLSSWQAQNFGLMNNNKKKRLSRKFSACWRFFDRKKWSKFTNFINIICGRSFWQWKNCCYIAIFFRRLNLLFVDNILGFPIGRCPIFSFFKNNAKWTKIHCIPVSTLTTMCVLWMILYLDKASASKPMYISNHGMTKHKYMYWFFCNCILSFEKLVPFYQVKNKSK